MPHAPDAVDSGDTDAVPLPVRVTVSLPERLSVEDADAERVCVAVPDGDALAVCVTVGEADSVAVCGG